MKKIILAGTFFFFVFTVCAAEAPRSKASKEQQDDLGKERTLYFQGTKRRFGSVRLPPYFDVLCTGGKSISKQDVFCKLDYEEGSAEYIFKKDAKTGGEWRLYFTVEDSYPRNIRNLDLRPEQVYERLLLPDLLELKKSSLYVDPEKSEGWTSFIEIREGIKIASLVGYSSLGLNTSPYKPCQMQKVGYKLAGNYCRYTFALDYMPKSASDPSAPPEYCRPEMTNDEFKEFAKPFQYIAESLKLGDLPCWKSEKKAETTPKKKQPK